MPKEYAERLPEETIIRIRQLLTQHGSTRVAKLVGTTKQHVNRIKQNRTYAKRGLLSVNSLELRLVATPKLCRRCGEPSTLFAKSLLCVKCELLELHKAGVIHITEEDAHGS